MFSYEMSVKLHDTDAAGLLFFGHQFKMAHDAYEKFMESIGFDFAHIINESDYLIAIVHTEADFKRALYVGDKLNIQLRVDGIGDSSYTLAYDLLDKDQNSAGTVKTVHVCIDKKDRQKRTLPESLRAALKSA